MIADKMRLPDLWLKLELALALLPDGRSVDYVDNMAFAQCVRGPKGKPDKFNKLIAGDDPIHLSDELYYFAATLEYLVLFGPFDGFGYQTIRDYLPERPVPPPLPKEALLGTFGGFCRSLLEVVRRRGDFQRLGGESYFIGKLSECIRQNLHDILDQTTTPGAAIAVLSGPDLRIVRQPAREHATVKVREQIQFLVPPAPLRRVVFGFELRSDDHVVTDPWSTVGSWFEPRIQKAGEALALLPVPDKAKHPYADVPGPYWVQVLAVEISGSETEAALPATMKKLTRKRYVDWPEGYAEAMAMITFADRISGNRKKAANRRVRLEFNYLPEAVEQAAPMPPGIHLHRAQYTVLG